MTGRQTDRHLDRCVMRVNDRMSALPPCLHLVYPELACVWMSLCTPIGCLYVYQRFVEGVSTVIKAAVPRLVDCVSLSYTSHLLAFITDSVTLCFNLVIQPAKIHKKHINTIISTFRSQKNQGVKKELVLLNSGTFSTKAITWNVYILCI